MDVRNERDPFKGVLVEKLKEFIKEDYGFYQEVIDNRSSAEDLVDAFDNEESDPGKDVMIHEEKQKEAMGKEIETIDKAWQAGVVHLIGDNEVVAAK